ncbi:zinc knuckle family protein [Perilla frutescens var. hirtella]|nr:zinc knuckle family protein [Perilla frutescens var. hirtella]
MASLDGNSNSYSASNPATTQTTSAGVCDRHGVSELYTSNTEGNPFRRFVHCPTRRVSGCGFFEWVDDELPAYYLGCVQRLKLQKESLESQLQYKNLMIKTLYEKLESKEAHSEGLLPAKIPVKTTPTTLTGKTFIVVGILAAIVIAAMFRNW